MDKNINISNIQSECLFNFDSIKEIWDCSENNRFSHGYSNWVLYKIRQ